MPDTMTQQRAAGAIMGAFIGDALALGPESRAACAGAAAQ